MFDTIGLMPELDAKVASRARATSLSKEQVIEVTPPFDELFETSGIERGSVVTVRDESQTGGATSLGFALLAAATSNGSWCAAVGFEHPGIVAIHELGVDLDRLILAPRPGSSWPAVVDRLMGGMDIVLVRPSTPLRPNISRRLWARARDRRCALVVADDTTRWPEMPSVCLVLTEGSWQGIGAGDGYLQSKQVRISARVRRGASSSIYADMLLGSTGFACR